MIKLLEKVTHDGTSYDIGDVIEKINSEDERRLVNLEVAFFVSNNNNNQDHIPSPDNDDSGNAGDTTDDQINVLHEELDSIDYQDLKAIAKELELEFPGNISKVNLITLIIDKGKASEVLALTEVED